MTFGRIVKTVIGLGAGLVLWGCTNLPDGASFIPNKNLPSYTQATYAEYVAETRDWLGKNRAFISHDTATELDVNSPFEKRPDYPTNKGVLLIHGLADSPYSFHDVANQLVKKGYLVRSLLIPGHGSRPADLMLPEYKDWKLLVEHHAALMKQEVNEIWMGGFSTGANLVTNYALQDDEISGLLLFSPAFKPKSTTMIQLAKWVKDVMPWADAELEDNFIRYNSLPTHGGALYAETFNVVTDRLEEYGEYHKPVFIALAEDDSVVDTDNIRRIFDKQFTHPDSRMIWLGDPIKANPRIDQFPMTLPKQRISTGSHMAPLFSPDNPYYGTNASIRICENGQTPEQQDACLRGAKIWYSHYGYVEDNKIHGRLTYNPYFNEMIGSIYETLGIEDQIASQD
ncbi:alpha/beta hydrolase [Curvivirga aplysinae]|uniref:alpha/beta hydrolase n=1 Tax=Curvivirga aplysinae TaxID=2529852 RepID=UPI0012BC5FE9|nr:alpha/beta fold hydrolase [Curvivirga aplysinae]MTI09961.1 alpha/beta fold hydrolase [Curvivirga aplysinae]